MNTNDASDLHEESSGHVYYSPEGKQLGMFPKNQANTMCVDVVSVYSPPVTRDRSPSVESKADTSPLTSSASSSSISSVNSNQDNQDLDDLELNEIISGVEIEDDSIFQNDVIKSTNKLNLTINKNINNKFVTKSKSNNATPVNKNFPRLPFESSTNSSNSSTNHLDSANSSVHSSTADLLKQKLRTNSQSSSSTITSMSLNKLKEIKQSINNISVGSSTSQNSTNKKSSQSLISQLSDDLSNRTRNIQSSFKSKRLNNLIGDEQPELANSSSNSNIKPIDKNNNPINEYEFKKQNSLSGNQFIKPAIPESDSMNLPPNIPVQPQEVSELSTENHQFLKDVIASVLTGQGVGYFKNNKIKRLMEDENIPSNEEE